MARESVLQQLDEAGSTLVDSADPGSAALLLQTVREVTRRGEDLPPRAQDAAVNATRGLLSRLDPLDVAADAHAHRAIVSDVLGTAGAVLSARELHARNADVLQAVDLLNATLNGNGGNGGNGNGNGRGSAGNTAASADLVVTAVEELHAAVVDLLRIVTVPGEAQVHAAAPNIEIAFKKGLPGSNLHFCCLVLLAH